MAETYAIVEEVLARIEEAGYAVVLERGEGRRFRRDVRIISPDGCDVLLEAEGVPPAAFFGRLLERFGKVLEVRLDGVGRLSTYVRSD